MIDDPAFVPVPESPCAACRKPGLIALDRCASCGWLWTAPSPEVRASARRWTTGLLWWGVVCSLVEAIIGGRLWDLGNCNAGILLMIGSGIRFAGILGGYHRPALGLLVLAVHAIVVLPLSFGLMSAPGSLEPTRLIGVALLLQFFNVPLFVVGLSQASRGEGGGPSLVRVWVAVLLGPFIGGLGVLIPGGLEIRLLCMVLATAAATIWGLRIVSVGDRGWRLPSAPVVSLLCSVGAGALLAFAGRLVSAQLVRRLDPSLLPATGFLREMPPLLGGAVVAVAIPALEEILFRGAIQGRLRAAWDPWSAILATAAVFALIHFTPAIVPWLLVLGVALGWAREKSGSLLPGFLLHGIYNGVLVFGFP